MGLGEWVPLLERVGRDLQGITEGFDTADLKEARALLEELT